MENVGESLPTKLISLPSADQFAYKIHGLCNDSVTEGILVLAFRPYAGLNMSPQGTTLIFLNALGRDYRRSGESKRLVLDIFKRAFTPGDAEVLTRHFLTLIR